MNLFRTLLKRMDDLAEHVVFDVLMGSPRRVLAVGLAAGLAGALAWSPSPAPEPELAALEPASLEYLTDRPWFDGYPVNPTPNKPYHAYLFTSDGMGIYITLKSRYTQEMELFYYKVKGNDIEIYLPETKTKARGPVTIGSANGPGDFDIKLALKADPKHNGGAGEYYSWKHWGNDASVAALLAEAHARVEAAR